MNHVHQGFASEADFLNHHRLKANGGDEDSQQVMKTHARIEQGRLYRNAVGRSSSKGEEDSPHQVRRTAGDFSIEGTGDPLG